MPRLRELQTVPIVGQVLFISREMTAEVVSLILAKPGRPRTIVLTLLILLSGFFSYPSPAWSQSSNDASSTSRVDSGESGQSPAPQAALDANAADANGLDERVVEEATNLPKWSQPPPPLEASSAEKLMLEQIEELVQAGEYEEAITNIEKLFDRSAIRIVAEGDVQRAGTLAVQRFIPLGEWARRRLVSLLASQGSLRNSFQRRLSDLARLEWKRIQDSKDILAAKEAAKLYFATDRGHLFCWLLADLYLERGWGIAAVQAAERACASLRTPVSDAAAADNIPWPIVWRQADPNDQQNQRVLQDSLQQPSLWDIPPAELLVQSTVRILDAASIDPESVDQQLWLQWASRAQELLPEPQQKRLSEELSLGRLADKSRDHASMATFAGNNRRNPGSAATIDVSQWPAWTQTLPLFTANSDRNPASKPRVGETSRGALPYHPVAHADRVYVNQLTSITAYEISSGRPWPERNVSSALYDSGVSSVAHLPLGYPFVGTPRGTLSIDQDCLFARMGPAITAPANGESAEDGGSLSYLIGLDLTKQGSMLSGFPLRLLPPEFVGCEFEGPPLVWGELLIVAIVQRDNVGLRRSVAAFRRDNGQLAWRSGVLAAGAIKGTERANLISHQILTEAGGRLFYNTNLGVIACLDPLDGQVVWITQYERQLQDTNQTAHADRFRYRDLTPCLCDRGLVYCAPQDCPEIFALDATSGHLIWATDSVQVADAIHLLGLHEEHLIVSGDRIAWLNRWTGRLDARFPGSSTSGPVHAPPQPRGVGRGFIAGGDVLWPVAGELMVFNASLPKPASPPKQMELLPKLKRRISLGARSNDGGNVVVVGDKILYLSPSRIMLFKPTSAATDLSLLR